MYRNVLVPVDGSLFSREAVVQGLRIASQSGGVLRLVRVGSAGVFQGEADSFAMENESLRQLHAAELADLYAVAAECRAHSTINVTASLQQGPVVDALIGYAKRHRVDLIVMRSHARRGLARAWFGSVTDGLIRGSAIPVIVVRPPSVATAVESGFHFKRILIPLDGSVLAEQSLGPAVALAKIDGARIDLIRIVTSKRGRANGELESAIGPAPATDVAEAQSYLESLLQPPMEGSIQVTRRVVVSNDAAASILDAAHELEADLIAIATRGRGSIARAAGGSVADSVMRGAAVSAMVLHPEIWAASVKSPEPEAEVARV